MAHDLEVIDGVASFAWNTTNAQGRPWWVSSNLVASGEHAGPMTYAEAETLARMDWDPVERDVVIDGATFADVKGIARSDGRGPLSVMGADYGVLPHRTAFRDWLAAAFGDGAAVVETAGVLDGGRRLFLSARLPGDFRPIGTRGDGIDLYLSLVTSHDGSISGTALASPIRPVCANTVRAALRSARFRYAVRHTPNVAAHARDVAQALAGIRRYHEQASETFSALAERQMSESELRSFLSALFPDPKREEGAEPVETPAVTRAKRERVRELFEGEGDGADLAGRTAWGALNALTQFVDREQGRARGVDRLARSLFSTEAQDTRDRALALLVGGAA